MADGASGKKKLQCICSNHLECSGVSAVFKVLRDRRCRFVELPPTEMERTLMALNQGDLPSVQESIAVAHQLRAAYLRHLDVDEMDLDSNKSYYVALHHFHPHIVKDSHSTKTDSRLAIVCRTVNESSWRHVVLDLKEEDRVPSTTASYFVVPNFPFERVKVDAQRAFKARRSVGSNVSVASTSSRRSLESKDSRASANSLPITSLRNSSSLYVSPRQSSRKSLTPNTVSPRQQQRVNRPVEAKSLNHSMPTIYYNRRMNNSEVFDEDLSSLGDSYHAKPPLASPQTSPMPPRKPPISPRKSQSAKKVDQPPVSPPPVSPAPRPSPRQSRVISSRIIRGSSSRDVAASPASAASRRSLGPVDLDEFDSSSDESDRENAPNTAGRAHAIAMARSPKAFSKSLPAMVYDPQESDASSSSPRKIVEAARSEEATDRATPLNSYSSSGRRRSIGPVDLDDTIVDSVVSGTTAESSRLNRDLKAQQQARRQGGLRGNSSNSAGSYLSNDVPVSQRTMLEDPQSPMSKKPIAHNREFSGPFDQAAPSLPSAAGLLSVSSEENWDAVGNGTDEYGEANGVNGPQGSSGPQTRAQSEDGNAGLAVFSAATAAAAVASATRSSRSQPEEDVPAPAGQQQPEMVPEQRSKATKGGQRQPVVVGSSGSPNGSHRNAPADDTVDTLANALNDTGHSSMSYAVPEHAPVPPPGDDSLMDKYGSPSQLTATPSPGKKGGRRGMSPNATAETVENSDLESAGTMPSPIGAASDDDEPSLGIDDEEEFWESSSDDASAGSDSGPVDVDRLTQSFLQSKRSFKGARLHSLFEASVSEFSEDDDLSLGIASRYIPPEELQPLKELTETQMDRTESIALLSAVESKRRCWSMAELESLKVEWKCYKQSLTNLAKETDWIAELLKSSFKSTEAYAGILQAIHCDSLIDDADGMVSSARKRTKLAAKRSTKVDLSIAPMSVMQPLFDMVLGTVDRINASVPALGAEVESITSLRTEVTSEVSVIAKAGDKIVYDVELMESNIQAAWAGFEKAASKAQDQSTGLNDDDWLKEAQYKRTASFGMSVFKKQCDELKTVFSKIVKLDVSRRSRTKEILLSFLPRRRRLYLRILEVFGPAMSRLEEGRLDKDETEKELEKALEDLNRNNLAKNTRGRSSILNRSRTFKFDLERGSPIDLAPVRNKNLFLDSGNVKEVKALEMKAGSDSWQLALAVITIDKYLHVMVCDRMQEIPLDDTSGTKQAEALLVSKMENRTPDFSIALSDCTSRLSSGRKHIEFTLDGSNPLQKVLKRKFCLRLTNPKATSQWFENHEELWSARSSKKEANVGVNVERV